jgi:hypothetical protein
MDRTPLVVAVFAAAALPAAAFASEVSALSKEDYYAATYYKQALEHPKIQKIKGESGKIKAVAADIRVSPKTLQKALAKFEALPGDPAELAVSAIKKSLQGSRVGGKVLDVLINTEEPKHVVVYVRWQGSSSKDVVKEASTIAFAVAKEAPFVSTLSLAAIHPKAPSSSTDSMWSAKIGHDQMGNIQQSRIDDYADRLYARLFEVEDNKPF